MRLYKIIYYSSKLILSWTICFLLLTHYNEAITSDPKVLVTNQLINPFFSTTGQQLSFMKLIMILGFSFMSFLATYTMMAEMSSNIKVMIKSHCKNTFIYQVSMYRLINGQFAKEFLGQVFFVVCFLIVNYRQSVGMMDILLFLLAWFFVDSICYFFITYYCSNSVLTIMLISFEIMFRNFFINHMIYILFCCCLYLCFIGDWRSKLVRNKKRSLVKK
ncbi:membrane protein [Streptococcus uberis]|nr:membrane protein [Streptococcus uberis]